MPTRGLHVTTHVRGCGLRWTIAWVSQKKKRRHTQKEKACLIDAPHNRLDCRPLRCGGAHCPCHHGLYLHQQPHKTGLSSPPPPSPPALPSDPRCTRGTLVAHSSIRHRTPAIAPGRTSSYGRCDRSIVSRTSRFDTRWADFAMPSFLVFLFPPTDPTPLHTKK